MVCGSSFRCRVPGIVHSRVITRCSVCNRIFCVDHVDHEERCPECGSAAMDCDSQWESFSSSDDDDDN